MALHSYIPHISRPRRHLAPSAVLVNYWRAMQADPKRAVRWLVFATLFISYSYFFQGGGWNPNARLDLTRALVSGQGFKIDDYRTNTGDWAYYDGHYYSNKSPGLSFLSLPAFALSQRISQAFFPGNTALALLIGGYVSNVAVNALASAILGLLVLETLLMLRLGSLIKCAWLSLACGLGTLAFPYSTAYYAHQPAAALSFAALLLLAKATEEHKNGKLLALVAGGAAGGAVMLELSTLVSVAILATVMLLPPRDRKLLGWFLLGGLPMAVGLGVYHFLCFGHPLVTGYDYSNPAIMVTRNGHLFGMPTATRVIQLLFTAHRGLFFTCPMLALSALGLVQLMRANRRLAVICCLVPISFVLLFSSFHGWEGGWTPGARYLIPSLPFLFVPAAFSITKAPRIFILLGCSSVVIMLLITAVTIEVPNGVANPVADFILPWLARGGISVNPQGLNDYLPALDYLHLRSTNNWNSFNLGELLFPHSVLSLLPLMLVWAAVALLMVRIGKLAAARNHQSA